MAQDQDGRHQVMLACEAAWRAIRVGEAAGLTACLHRDFAAQGFPSEAPAEETPVEAPADGAGTEKGEGGESDGQPPSRPSVAPSLMRLCRFFAEGSGLTNVVHRIDGIQILGNIAVSQLFWMAEEGLGEDGSPRFVSGIAVLTLLRQGDEWRLSGWLGTPGPHRPRDSAERATDVEAIREQILRVFEAYRQKSQAVLRRTHTADWRGFALSSASVGRGIDAYMRAAQNALVSVQFEEYRILELDAIFYGDIAIVPYVAVVAGRTARGRREESRLRVMDVYLREPGGWNQIASNVCLHPVEIRGR